MNGIVAGLLAKDVDAIVGTTAGSLALERDGKARILVKAGAEIHEFIADMVYASEPMMQKRPAVLRRFLVAWFETSPLHEGEQGRDHPHHPAFDEAP